MIKEMLSRVRRNHGLEHATLNLLAARHPGVSYAGHSDFAGFWILGEISSQELAETVLLALEKLASGQESLAIHKNCGTNLLASGFLAGMAGAAGLIGAGSRPRDKIERLPVITALGVLALVAARPLGPALQKLVTTSGKPGSLKVSAIQARVLNGVMTHRVTTQD